MLANTVVLLLVLLALALPVAATLGVLAYALDALHSSMPLTRALGEVAWTSSNGTVTYEKRRVGPDRPVLNRDAGACPSRPATPASPATDADSAVPRGRDSVGDEDVAGSSEPERAGTGGSSESGASNAVKTSMIDNPSTRQ